MLLAFNWLCNAVCATIADHGLADDSLGTKCAPSPLPISYDFMCGWQTHARVEELQQRLYAVAPASTYTKTFTEWPSAVKSANPVSGKITWGNHDQRLRSNFPRWRLLWQRVSTSMLGPVCRPDWWPWVLQCASGLPVRKYQHFSTNWPFCTNMAATYTLPVLPEPCTWLPSTICNL